MAAKDNIYDLCIIGGGIHGAGIARDATLRGLKVVLLEQNGLASGTSSWSSKLIHGGLRYLETYHFRLVRNALKERETLHQIAPHLNRPLGTILPLGLKTRPKWLVRLGLFLYDHLYHSRAFAKTRTLNPNKDALGMLKETYQQGFLYQDGQSDDVRLVMANIKDAANNGALIAPYTKVTHIAPNSEKKYWKIQTIKTHCDDAQEQHFYAKAIVNAAGPWADKIITQQAQSTSPESLRMIQGSHIVVKKRFESPHGFILQNQDQRIIFVLPFKQDFTLIGTTDVPFEQAPEKAHISHAEKAYLLASYNLYFKDALNHEDIIWDYSGVRAICDSGDKKASKANREHHITTLEKDQLKMISILGGKLTSYRLVSKQALDQLQSVFPNMRQCQTDKRPLAGGAFEDFQHTLNKLEKQFNFMPQAMVHRLFLDYGMDIQNIFKGCQSIDQLGKHFGGNLYQKEVDYLIQQEWAANDYEVLYNRTKQGLYFSKEQTQKLKDYIESHKS